MDNLKIFEVVAIWSEHPYCTYEFYVQAHSPEEAALRLMNYDKKLRVKSVYTVREPDDKFLRMPSDWKPEHTETQFRVLTRYDHDYHKAAWKSTESVYKSRGEADAVAFRFNKMPTATESVVVEEIIGFSELGEFWKGE